MYNNKILQHYVEHEWNQTNSDLVVSGEQRRVATNDKELDESLAAEIQQVEFDVPEQGMDMDHSAAKPFVGEALGFGKYGFGLT